MSRRTQMVLIGLIVLVVGIEIAVRITSPSRTSVQIINAGDTPIENLVVIYGGSRVAVGTVPTGEKTQVGLTGWRKGTLSLEFTQQGNPMSGFQIANFDPRAMHRDGLRQVLTITPNQVMKYMDDDSDTSPLGRLGGRISDWVSAELELPR